MSGEAGAEGISKYCHIYYSSGMMVNVAAPPNIEDHANYVGEYFERANIPFQEELKKVIPELDILFEQCISAYQLPIIPFSTKSPYVEGLIIEDTPEISGDRYLEKQGKNRLVNSKYGSANIQIIFMTTSFKKITLTITVNKSIKRSSINTLKAEILVLFD